MTDAELENRKILLKSFLFRDSPPEALDELARTVQSRVAGPNEIIFKEGDPPDAFYIIGSGRVRIFVSHKDRIERELSVRGPGEHFGEVALLAGDTRSANAESLVETQLVVFSKEQFDSLLRDYPDLSRNFVREMRGWLLKDQEIIEEEANAVMRASRVFWFDFVLVIGVSVLLAITFNFSNPYGIPLVPERPEAVASISASAAMEDYRLGQTLFVDARPNNFYRERHIQGAVNMPMAIFDIVYLMSFSEEEKDKKIVVYGNTISRPYDLEIADKLLLRGYTHVKVLDGSLQAWEADGYPVEQEVSR
ncbi:MAG TPA: cyclic nucleotide-binding domain-containing protein [Deltaproteobacteria bacterium]|jgi:rhodanese-related sulfurtransferase|nr:cyclic nucleotide-binding domain-containing protein [Deltaproteobacteria bacterium]